MLKTEHIEFPSNAKAHITLPSCPDYDIEEDEVIDVWIPAEALAESDKPIYAGFFTIKAESYQERIDHAIQGMSARQLRNKIVHRMKPQYRSAVRERYESLMGTMTEFLSAVEGWRIRSRGGETES